MQQTDIRPKPRTDGSPPATPLSGSGFDARPNGASAARRKPRKRKGKRLALLAIVVVAAGIAIWRWYPAETKAVAPAEITAEVVRRDFASSVLATGAVKPQVGAEVRVGARISGKVERLRANIGDPVQAGQVIAELEKADLQALVAQRQAEADLAEAKLAAVESLHPKEIEKAEADLTRRQATLHLSQQEERRQTQLLDQAVTTEEEWQRAEERRKVAEAEVAAAQKVLELAKAQYVESRRQAEVDVERAKAALRNTEVQLSYATIVAPISGVIGSVSTQEGETVAAGLNSPTFVTIIDLNRLQVDAMVDEVDIGKVRPGQKAAFTVDAFPAREFPGKVVAIYPKAVLLENVVYYDVVVEIQGNDDEVLRPEMTASVTILLDAKEGALAIPAKALKRERGKSVVCVMRDGRPQPREVKAGWKDGSWIEVAAGLEEGETVLLETPADSPAAP